MSSSVGNFLRRSFSRTKEEKKGDHPVIAAVDNLPPPPPVQLKAAKKAFTDLKSPRQPPEKRGAALKLINQFLMEQESIGERYHFWKHEFKGLQSLVNSIKNPPEGSLLYEQIQYFKKLVEADESIMEAITRRSQGGGQFGTKNAHEFDDIMSLAKELLVFKTDSTTGIRRQGSIRRSNSSIQRQNSLRRSDTNIQLQNLRRSNSDVQGNRGQSSLPPIPSSLGSTVEAENEEETVAEVNNNDDTKDIGDDDEAEKPSTKKSSSETSILPSIPEQSSDSEEAPLPSSSQLPSVNTTSEDEHEKDAVQEELLREAGEGVKDDDGQEECDDTTLRPGTSTSHPPLSPIPSIDSAIEDVDDEVNVSMNGVQLVRDVHVEEEDAAEQKQEPSPQVPGTSNPPPAPPLPGFNHQIPAPPPLPRTPGGPPPPPPLPTFFGKIPPPPPSAPTTPLLANGMTPPPPPPPGGKFNFLTCGFKKPESTKCIKYNKKNPTVACRWAAISDNDAKNTMFEKIESPRLSDEVVDELERLFKKKPQTSSARPSLAQRSIKEVALNSVNDKKKLAIELIFKKLKMSVDDLMKAITTSLNPNVSKDILESLMKVFPTENELEPYKSLISSSNFGDADLFCFHVSRHPGVKFLIELIVAKQELQADMQRSHGSISIIQTAFDSIIRVYPQLKMLCEKVWQIGNYLNQNTNNYGAAGFEFNDLVRILLITTEDTPLKMSVMDVIVENFPSLKSELFKILKLKIVISEACKPVLDEITGIIEMAAKKVKDLEDRLEEIEINENMKDPAKNDLHNILNLIDEQKHAVERLNVTKVEVFRYLVVKKMSLGEFLDYFKTVIATIDAAYEKQSSEFTRHDTLRHSMIETPTTSSFQRDSNVRQSFHVPPQTPTSSKTPNLKDYLQKRRGLIS